MSDDLESDDNKESGSALRQKLEAALSENAAARKIAVENLVKANGYRQVTVEDLKDVSIAELEAKAKEVEATKAKADESALRRVLETRGLSGEELEATVKSLVGESSQDEAAATADRIRSVGRLGGTPPQQVNDMENLSGPDLVMAAYAKRT